MIIDAVYYFLCSLYGINTENPPSLFLLKKHPEKKDFLIGNRHYNREAVFAIRNLNEEWFVGIYINPKIIKRIESLNFSDDDIGCVVEGVSHFIYLTNIIDHDEKVSLLELELQAEIDKFLYLSAIGNFQPIKSTIVYNKLFDLFSYDSNLSDDDKLLYERANHFAKLYCHAILEQILQNHHEIMMKNITSFYYKRLSAKLDEISKT